MKKLGLLTGLLFFSTSGLSEKVTEQNTEQLLGVSVDQNGITFQVQSNGCTDKDDFYFQVEEVLEEIGPMLPAFEHNHYITVNRLTTDGCEYMLPWGTFIFVSFQELGIQFGKFHVNNPIGGYMISRIQ